MIQRLLEENPPDSKNFATDYDSVIISVDPLFKNSAQGLNQVTDTEHWLSNDRARPNNRIIKSQVKYLGNVNTTGLLAHVKAGTELKNLVNELKALNIITWKNIIKPEFQGGRAGNKFYPVDAQQPRAELASANKSLYFIRNGFFSSMRPGDDALLLNMNAVTSAFFTPMELQTWIEICWPQTSTIRNRDFKPKLKDVRVTLDLHTGGEAWVICGINSTRVSGTTFTKDDGTEISVANYLRTNTKYQSHPWLQKDWDAFCINVGKERRPIWYPATKLTIIDWQILREKVDESYSKEMLLKATKLPQQNKELLPQAYSYLGLNTTSSHLTAFGIKPSTKMVELATPKLNAPSLVFDTKDTIPIVQGAWNLKTHPKFLQKARDCKNLFVINLSQANVKSSVEELFKWLVYYGLCKGVTKDFTIKDAIKEVAKAPPWPPSDRESQEDYRETCRVVFRVALKGFDTSHSLIPFVLVILPERNVRMYQELKTWADCQEGIPTVCVTKEKIEKIASDATLCANICLKINFKLKGVSHKIKSMGLPNRGITSAQKNTIIMGADVTHPGQGIDNCPSIAAVVATGDDDSSRYLGSARLQKARQEFISDLRGMIKERIIAWNSTARQNPDLKKRTWKDRLPSHILFYRDGVSESQYGMVLHEEKPQIIDGCKDAFAALKKDVGNAIGSKENWTPKLTLLVVTKRHHARFYPKEDCKAGVKAVDINLESGTVVDTKVVTPNHQSFYLQSHHSALGPARSAHYIVIYNGDKGNDYSLSELQNITNNICYTSARATKAVSVCTPARYADILCDRMRCYMYPALKGFHTAGPSSPRISVSDTLVGPDDFDNPRYIKTHAEDPYIWKGPAAQGDTRMNPWSSSLDKCMFYL